MTDTKVPIWLLDIDGVVNAVTQSMQRKHAAWSKDSWVEIYADSGTATWKIQAATPVLDFIRKVHDSGQAEIRWHTTWQKNALNVSRGLGLPDFAVQEAPEYDPGFWQRMRGSDSWWKLPAARRVIQLESRPVIWTDDDIHYEMNPRQRQALRDSGNVLLIAPDSYAGLCQPDLDRIDKFLKSPGEGK